MAIDKIPEHFLIPIAFLYQADAQLRGGGGGAEAGEASFAGRTKKLAQKMVADGWRKAVTDGKTPNFGFLYRPEHWDEDTESYPPVTPKTDAAEDFLLDVQKGDRLNFSVRDPETGKDIKSGIMDALVQELSGGAVQRFSLSANARKNMEKDGQPQGALAGKLAGAQNAGQPRAGASKAAKPIEGIDPWVPIPEPVVKSVGKREDPERGDLDLMKRLDGAGYVRAKKGTATIWIDPAQWEPAIGGIGILPLTDEAEMYQDRLDDSAVMGVLPRAMVQKTSDSLKALLKR